MATLPEMDLLKIEQKTIDERSSVFTIEPLLPGYGITIGNTLRRILLSSLPGAAIHAVKVNDLPHEFSPIPGVKEDLIELILNLKSMRLKLNQDEPATLVLNKKTPGEVKAKDFAPNAAVEVLNHDHYLASLNKGAQLSIEAMVNLGRGYLPTERKREEKLPIGWIMVDSNYSPVEQVNYTVENTRVGQQTDYNKLILEIKTNSTIDCESALKQAAAIAMEHFEFIRLLGQPITVASPSTETEVIQPIEEIQPEEREKKTAKKPKSAKKPA